MNTIDRRCDSYSKPFSKYHNKTVQCGGKKGDSVKLGQSGESSCPEDKLYVHEMKVYGTALSAIIGKC